MTTSSRLVEEQIGHTLRKLNRLSKKQQIAKTEKKNKSLKQLHEVHLNVQPEALHSVWLLHWTALLL